MSLFCLRPERVFDGERFVDNVTVVIEQGRIVALTDETLSDAEILPGLLVPGFIDVQVNGGGGVLFNDSPTVEAIAAIGRAHAAFGSTGFLPTLISDDFSVMQRAADAVAAALAQGVPGVLGIHFEGPHIAPAKRGVHDARFIRPLSEAEFGVMTRRDLGARVVTLAPECVGLDDIRRLSAEGVRVCLGHSNADYALTRQSLQAGACGFTHLFNAMSPLTSREPGMVGAALEDEVSWCGLIVDGFHVHAATARLALRAKRRGKVMLITDAMPPVGTTLPSFELLGETIFHHDGKLTTAAGTLAGSALTMAAAVRYCVSQLQLPLNEALRMASLYPAQFLKMGSLRGTLKAGAAADLVLLDDVGHVQQCWIGGVATRPRPKVNRP